MHMTLKQMKQKETEAKLKLLILGAMAKLIGPVTREYKG